MTATPVGRVTVEIEGRRAELALRVPTAGFELPLLPGAGEAAEPARHRELVALLLGALVASIDGEPLSEPRRSALAAHPDTVVALLRVRQELHERLVHEGRLRLDCPRCGHAAELTLVSLMIALDAPPWPIVDARGEPAVPSLSTLRPLAPRPPGAVAAARARIVLPSTRAALDRPFSEAAYGPALDAARDAAGWRRWGGEGKPFDVTRAHWRWGNAGFRAILRMALALARLDDIEDVTPELIERLPVTDFRFADVVHHYLFGVGVDDVDRASLTCAGCGQRFLPVL